MRLRLTRYTPLWHLSLIIILALTLLIPLFEARAQDAGQMNRYQHAGLGIAFDLPLDWVVEVSGERLVLGNAADINSLNNDVPPQGLVMFVDMGSFKGLGIETAAELPNRVRAVVPAGIALPDAQAVTYGNSTGYEIEYTLPDVNVRTRVALLSIGGGRLAVVRGLSAEASWESNIARFNQVTGSLEFSAPLGLAADPFATLPDSDGGVLWHYQSGQTNDTPLTLGGLTYDEFGVMYVAAGPRGFLALSQEDGSFMNFLGPIRDDDNFVDVSISRDARLFFANASPGDNERIMMIDRVGNFIRSWGNAGEQPGQFAPGMPQTITVTRDGDVWAISEGHSVQPANRLYRFDVNGNLIETIDLGAVNPRLKGARLANQTTINGGLVVVGREGGLNLLDANGQPLVTGIDEALLTEAIPLDVNLTIEENVVVATQNEGFLLMTPLGELVDRFGISYDETRSDAFQPGEYREPAGIAVGQDNTIYFAETHPDTGFAQVQAFRFAGDGNLPLAADGEGAINGGEPGIVASSAGGPITYGQTVRGTITNQNDQHDYTFEAISGDRIVITMQDISGSQSLDPFLYLLDSSGGEVTYSDDVPPPVPQGLRSTDSVIRFLVGVSGTYTIRATRFGGFGEYELSLEQVASE